MRLKRSKLSGSPPKSHGVSERALGPVEVDRAPAHLTLERLRAATAAFLKAAPRPISKAMDVKAVFGVDYTLAWQMHRIATAETALMAGTNVPARGSVERLIEGARKRGIEKDVLEGLQRAFDDFERLVELEAGDRKSFEAMMRAQVPDLRADQELESKRAAFTAHSQLRGIAVETEVCAAFRYPSTDGESIDSILVQGKFGARLTKPGAAITLGIIPTAKTPLDLTGRPCSNAEDLFLGEFCSDRRPRCRTSMEQQTTYFTLEGEHVGLRGACDVVFATRNSGLRRYRPTGAPPIAGVTSTIDVPTKRLTFDVFMHKDLYASASPSLAIYDTLMRGRLTRLGDPEREMDRLDVHESVQSLGVGLSKVSMSYVPRYPDILKTVFAQVPYSPGDFRVYRLDVLYPVCGSQFLLAFPFPDKPTAP